MGFIDYHGTKENRYGDVLEYAHAQQEEDWRRKEQEKIRLWLQELLGDGSISQLTIKDYLKYIIVYYKHLHLAVQKIFQEKEKNKCVDTERLWNDFSIDIAARHLMLFHLPDKQRLQYLAAFQMKIFKLNDPIQDQNYFQLISEHPDYRRYFVECFDPTWKGRQFFKLLQSNTKKLEQRGKLVKEFISDYEKLVIFIGLYLNQLIEPKDDAWMHDIEIERSVLWDIQKNIQRNGLARPDYNLLINPLFNARGEQRTDFSPKSEANEDQNNSVPQSGLDKKTFYALVEKGGISNFILASKMLTESKLPEDITDIYRMLSERMPVLQDAIERFDNIYHADMDQFEEYYAPETLKLTAVYLDYLAVRPAEKILKETKEGVFLAAKKLLQVVNSKIDEIYRFVVIDANAEAKALETIMSQDGYVDPAYKIKNSMK